MPELFTKIKSKLSRNAWIAVAGFCVAALLMITILALLPEENPTQSPPQSVPQATEPAPTLPRDEFAYVNGYLTCLTRPSQLGIDISSHQEQINWEAVRSAGVEFVMLRLGYRGNDLGGIYEDEDFRANYAAARDAGLKIGAYFYSQAITVEEAQEEAAFALTILQDYPLDMPLVYDWEVSGPGTRVDNMDRNTLTAATLAFCQAVEEAGLQPMIYFNPDQARTLLHMDQLIDYPLWLAMYSGEMTLEYPVDMWQYTNQGSVSGIDEYVDINLYFPAN